MRLLVNIVGQLRTWEYSHQDLGHFIGEVVAKLRMAGTDQPVFSSDAKVDILVSYWDISYQIYPDYHTVDFIRAENASTVSGGVSYLRSLPFVENVFLHNESYQQAESLFQSLRFTLPEEHHFPSYLLFKAGLQKRRIEVEGNKTYDLVLFLRPDVLYVTRNSLSGLPSLPLDGDVYCLTKLLPLEIHGLALPVFTDLIFLMTGATYNRFTKEIVYYYENYLCGRDFTSVQHEKNFFFGDRNLIARDQRNSLCVDTVIVRPTLDAHLWRAQTAEERYQYLRELENSWTETKNENLQKQFEHHRTFAAHAWSGRDRSAGVATSELSEKSYRTCDFL